MHTLHLSLPLPKHDVVFTAVFFPGESFRQFTVADLGTVLFPLNDHLYEEVRRALSLNGDGTQQNSMVWEILTPDILRQMRDAHHKYSFNVKEAAYGYHTFKVKVKGLSDKPTQKKNALPAPAAPQVSTFFHSLHACAPPPSLTDINVGGRRPT